MELLGKVFVVTGGGNGIGQQIVLTLLAKGASVAAVDIDSDALETTVELSGSLSTNLTTHQTNITDRESVSKLVDLVVEKHGNVDGVVNNAGVIHPFKPLNLLDYDVIERVVNVNLFGVINITKAFLPLLLKRPIAHIVNVSSMGGLFAFPKQTLYGASKAAVKLLSEGLYSELRGTSVGVTVVFPGAVNTNITKNCNSHPEELDKFSHLHPGAPPKMVAKRIVGAIEKNKFRLHIGTDSKVLSFLYRVFPKSTILLLGKLMKMVMPD